MPTNGPNYVIQDQLPVISIETLTSQLTIRLQSDQPPMATVQLLMVATGQAPTERLPTQRLQRPKTV